MGAVCHGQSKQKKQKIETPKEQIEESKQIHQKQKNKTVPPSVKELEEEPPLQPGHQRTKQLLQNQKKFSGLLDLLGNLDQLQSETRDKLSLLIILRSNINIMIHNTIKRTLREKNIIKKVEDEDEELLYPDQKFSIQLAHQMKKVQEIILQLEKDDEFQAAFPILCFSFIDLKDQINATLKEYDEIKEKEKEKQNQSPTRLDVQKKKNSDESFNNRPKKSTQQ